MMAVPAHSTPSQYPNVIQSYQSFENSSGVAVQDVCRTPRGLEACYSLRRNHKFCGVGEAGTRTGVKGFEELQDIADVKTYFTTQPGTPVRRTQSKSAAAVQKSAALGV